jgi:hypothetical protein
MANKADHDSGFILLSSVWLLVLGGVIVSTLMFSPVVFRADSY